MVRFAAMGLFIAAGTLTGCQLDTPSDLTTTNGQAVRGNLCRGMVPTPVRWDGSSLPVAGETSTYVYFPYFAENHSSAGQDASGYLFALVDTDAGEVGQAFLLENDGSQLSEALAQVATAWIRVPGTPPQPCVRMLAREVAVDGVRVPGDPPDPCVRQSNLCAQAIVDIAGP